MVEETICRKTKGSAQFDGEEPGVDGGLAFGEWDGLSADGEFGGEEIVVADDQQAVVGKQGETFPLFRQLIPWESFGRKVEGIKIKQGKHRIKIRIRMRIRMSLAGDGKWGRDED